MLEKKFRLSGFGQEVIAVTALLLLVALRFFPMLADGRLYAPFRDNVFIYGPIFSETARIALHGSVPFYLPSFAAGFPVFQSPHYSPFYPFYFFGLLDYGGPLQSLRTLTYLSLFHRVILALNFFVMLRSARVSPWAAFVGASIGVFASNTELYAGWITIASTYTWFPLLVAGAILLTRNPDRSMGVLLLGGSIGMLVLASASQSFAHALFFCLIFFSAGAVWIFLNRSWRSLLQLMMSLAAAGAIAFGLAAVAAIPVYLGIEGMIRHLSGGFVLDHQPIPWEKFNGFQMSLKDLTAILVNPGSVEVVGSPYVGPLGLAGVVFALLFFRRLDPIAKLCAGAIGAIGCYGLLSACGTNLGFAYLNFHLPLINRIREAGRHLVLFVIAVVFLAGVGFDQLGRLRSEDGAKRRTLWFTAASLLVIFAAVVAWEFSKQAPLANGGGVVLLLAPAIALVGLVFEIKTFYLFIVPAMFVSLASAISPVRAFDIDHSDYGQSDNLRSLEILSAVRDKVGPGDFRIDFEDKKFHVFTWGMNASYFRLNSFYNRLTPQPYDQFRFSLQRRIPYLRAMMGARYVLCAANEKPSDPGAQMRFEINGYKLFENPAYMGRVTLVHGFAGAFRDEAQFIASARRGFDFLQSAYLQEKDTIRLKSFLSAKPPGNSAAEDHLYVAENSVNQAVTLVEASRPGIVILNEWFSQSWKAKVNGIVKPICRVNQWQVGVPVLGGRSMVEFTYRPSVCWRFLILNRITWLLLVSVVFVRFIRHLRQPASDIAVQT